MSVLWLSMKTTLWPWVFAKLCHGILKNWFGKAEVALGMVKNHLMRKERKIVPHLATQRLIALSHFVEGHLAVYVEHFNFLMRLPRPARRSFR